MKKPKQDQVADLQPEYDFSQGVRGKYVREFHEGSNVVILDPDVAAKFPDSTAVNEALRRMSDSETDDPRD